VNKVMSGNKERSVERERRIRGGGGRVTPWESGRGTGGAYNEI